MQPERKYRSILPGPPANTSSRSLNDDNGDATSSTSGGIGGQEGSKRKRRGTAKACNNCREKKIGVCGSHLSRCSCHVCSWSGCELPVLRIRQSRQTLVSCEYVAISKTILNSIPRGMKLLDEATAKTQRYAAELLAILRSLPDDQVRDVLQQLRAGGDASNIVAALRGQLHSAYDVPFHGTLHRVPPPDQNSLEFELMVRHSIAYSPWAPTELSQLDFKLSARPSQSISVESPSAAVSPMSADTPSPMPPTESESSFSSSRIRFQQEPRESSSSSLSVSVPVRFSSREAGPADLRALCDERLHKIDISAWTNVSVAPDSARRALSLYLETDHTVTALFDVDLLLDSLVSGNTRFCSRLLFSSLLSWACVHCNHTESEAASWSYAFYDEAAQLLEQDRNHGLLTPVTVAALLYMSMSSMCHAKNTTDAKRHLEIAIELAGSIGLFGVAGEEASEVWSGAAADVLWNQAMAQTAWGSFVYITIQCAHNQTCKIAFPPRVPIPGDVGESEGMGKSEEQGFPAYMRRTFLFLCKLVLVAHDMIRMNYAGSGLNKPPYSRAEEMELVYKRYLAWADGLPLDLVRAGESEHHVLLLHVYFHTFVLDLFRPLIRHGDAMRVKLESFTSQQASPEAICAASATQLRRIAATYLQTCASASYSFSWNTALLYVANAASREPKQGIDGSDRRSDVRACIVGYQKLQKCFRLPQAIIRGLLSMVLREGLITSAEARAIIRDSEEKGKHHPTSDPILAPFVIDLDLCLVDREAALADRLAAEFDEIAMLNEFTMVTQTREGLDVGSENVAFDVDG
ncbi:C6 transcription factor [Colletotrichum kahawae]|uniref:C6 transcription factor n=1 Tax=Colletotrichum kahawae TaxID=34407 RepID=A0AAD9Y0Y1_COLKA|nr:C6 transcription factor [Colletotrichum kahawae]